MFFLRHISKSIQDSFRTFPVILVTGPRQVGKSTILRELYPDLKVISFDSFAIKAGAKEDPAGFLQLYKSPIVFDEIQKVSELFEELKAVIEPNM